MKILNILVTLCNIILAVGGTFCMYERAFGNLEFEKFATVMLCAIFSLVASFVLNNFPGKTC